LYSYRHQQEIQNGLFPSNIRDNGCLLFAYPPFVALAYYPLALLPYRISFLVYGLSMMAGLAISIQLLRRKLYPLQNYGFLLLGATLLYYPMLRSILGGQNTAITFLFFILVWYFGQARREWLAGFFLGLMFFKPQYGIPLIGLHLLAGRWRTVLGSVAVGGILYFIAAQIFGPSWMREWIIYASWFSKIDAAINGANSVSLLGFFQAVLGVKSRAAAGIGLFLTAVTTIGISFVWFKARNKRDFSLEFALASIAIVVIQPHAMYYDMGILIFAYIVFICYYRIALKEVIFLWMLTIIQFAATPLGFSPLFFLLVWSGFLGIRIYKASPKIHADQRINSKSLSVDGAK
jgi:hypothetical protein